MTKKAPRLAGNRHNLFQDSEPDTNYVSGVAGSAYSIAKKTGGRTRTEKTAKAFARLERITKRTV